MCRNYKSGNRCTHGNDCLYRYAGGGEKPSKRSKSESTQGAVAILKEKVQGCVSQNSDPKKSILRKAGQTRLSASAGHAIKILRTQVRSSNWGKKRAISRCYPKKVNLMSEILARRSLRKEHLRKPHDKKSTPAKQHRRQNSVFHYNSVHNFVLMPQAMKPVLLLEHQKITRMGQTSRKNFSVVLRHGRTCSKMRGTVLRTGKQDRAITQGFSSLFGRSPNQKGRFGKRR